MARQTFYRSGSGLGVSLPGEPEDRQHIAAMTKRGRLPCPGSGCQAYEKGWDIDLNMADPEDANLARFIREGKAQRKYAKALLMPGVIRFHFLAEQPCMGHHAAMWAEDEKYVVGTRQATQDEFDYRFQAGGEALAVATQRLKEMED